MKNMLGFGAGVRKNFLFVMAYSLIVNRTHIHILYPDRKSPLPPFKACRASSGHAISILIRSPFGSNYVILKRESQ